MIDSISRIIYRTDLFTHASETETSFLLLRRYPPSSFEKRKKISPIPFPSSFRSNSNGYRRIGSESRPRWRWIDSRASIFATWSGIASKRAMFGSEERWWSGWEGGSPGWGRGSRRGEGGANSSSVQVRNYNGAIHHERPPIRHADPRVQPVFEYNPRTYIRIRTSQLTPRNNRRCLLLSSSTGDLAAPYVEKKESKERDFSGGSRAKSIPSSPRPLLYIYTVPRD